MTESIKVLLAPSSPSPIGGGWEGALGERMGIMVGENLRDVGFGILPAGSRGDAEREFETNLLVRSISDL